MAAPAASGATVEDLARVGTGREAFVTTLEDLKARGKARAWDSVQLVAEGAEVPTEARVRAYTGIDGARDLLSREEVGTDELGAFTAAVFVASAVLAVLSGVVVGGNFGASLTYVFAVLPIVFLGVGSSSPGVIVALYGAIRGSAADDAPRRRRHEAAHLVAGYRLGLPVASYDAASDVAFYDESGRVAKSRDDGERLAAVALAGAVAECDAFGDARGAQGDFAALQRVFDAVEPRLSPAEQQAATRRGVLNAYAVLYGGARNRRDATLVEAADADMAGGASLPAVLAAIEAAAAEAA